MGQIIPITWYTESPIDFEHKQYVLLSYLQIVDSSFIQKKLSPHFLHMEKMVVDMLKFQQSFELMKKRFDKERYIFFDDNPKLINEKNILVEEINEIIEFSIPQIRTRIDLGGSILKKTNQVLF